MADTPQETAKPVRFKASKRSLVTASVFTNHRVNDAGEAVTYHSVTLQQAYTDKNNTWKHTNTITARDLDDALIALQKAKAHIEQLQNIATQEQETQKLVAKPRSQHHVAER